VLPQAADARFQRVQAEVASVDNEWRLGGFFRCEQSFPLEKRFVCSIGADGVQGKNSTASQVKSKNGD